MDGDGLVFSAQGRGIDMLLEIVLAARSLAIHDIYIRALTSQLARMLASNPHADDKRIPRTMNNARSTLTQAQEPFRILSRIGICQHVPIARGSDRKSEDTS